MNGLPNNGLLKRNTGLFILLLFLFSESLNGQLRIAADLQNETIRYGLNRLREKTGISLDETIDIQKNTDLQPDLLIVSPKDIKNYLYAEIKSAEFAAIKTEGFRFKWLVSRKTLCLLYQDPVGALYGIMEIKETLESGKPWSSIPEKTYNPHLEYRIIKFNLPWSPYRNHEAVTLHTSTCRNLKFWEKFLDRMVDNRWNALSLWNIHPFPFMIQSKSFPLANAFSEMEMREWKQFWTSLFDMAGKRGIQSFVVNWNIAVSPAFAKNYHVSEYSSLSDTVKKYTRESVTQLIDEYPGLTGIGVTLADWMGTFDEKMTPQQREDWIEETFVAGMKDASRPVKFIHRSVLAGDPMAMRTLLDRAKLKEPALVEIKFNWSHGHSTPKLAITHDYHSGKLDERFWSPKPDDYRIQWMIRNEDFFILRWGQAGFIREHIRQNNKNYVNGYFIGSEGYVPAVNYYSIHDHHALPEYAFEHQWLFYAIWGRLLYDPELPDEFFIGLLDNRYGKGSGKSLWQAINLASKMPLRLASFFRSTWDYTLYSEGFLAPEPSNPNGFFDRTSPFISIDELIHHETLDPKMVSIEDFVQLKVENKKMQDSQIGPLQVAMQSEKDSKKAFKLYKTWTKGHSHPAPPLASEWADAATWAHLGLYFSHKLRAGVALHTFRHTGRASEKQKAILELESALVQWKQVAQMTKDRYKATPHVSLGRYRESLPLFSWVALLPQVERDLQIARNAQKGEFPQRKNK